MTTISRTERQLRLALAETFIKGQRPTQRHLAELVRRAGIECTQRQVGIYFTKWSEAGLCETQRAGNGHSGAAYIFNFSGRPYDTVTLRHIVEPVLVAADQSDDGGFAMKLRSALRLALGVDEYNADGRLLLQCEEVTPAQFYELPERAYAAALQSSGKRAAANYRSAVRALLRDAVHASSVPIVFPKIWEDDAWSEARDRYFGSTVGPLSSTMRQYRTYWHHYAATARELPSKPRGPADVTAAMVEEICAALKRKAKMYLPNQVKTMLRWVARVHHEGPYVAHVGQGGVTWTRNGWRNADRLLGPSNEAAADGDWPTFLRIVEHNGYGRPWLEHLEWYGEFVSLPEFEIEQREERFPTRPARWRLDPTTRISRVNHLRMILFHAPRIIGKPADKLTVHDVLGDGGRRMLAGLRARWAERYKLKEVSSANSHSVEDLVLALGLLARSLALRIEHAIARGADAGLAGLGTAPLTQQQAAYETTYKSAREQAKAIELARKREPSGHGDNSVRSVRRIIENTPARYWIAVLDESMRHVQSHLRHDARGMRLEHDPGAGLTRYDFFCLVTDTYYHGWLVTTGMRISETAHVRLDLQYDDDRRSRRVVHLRSADRKETTNTLAHECMVRERFVPAWLEQLYLEQARPFFMQEWPVAAAGRGKRRDVQQHPWLFVDRKGRPVGCPEEDGDGEGRDKIRLRGTLAGLRKQWQVHCARVAVKLGLPVSVAPREYSNHVVRIAMGYQIRQEFGLTEAANYLGDQEGSIIGHYEGVSGKLVDHSTLGGQYVPFEPPTMVRERQKRTVADAARESGAESRAQLAGAAQARLRLALDRLVEQFATGEIEQTQFMERSRRLEGALAAT